MMDTVGKLMGDIAITKLIADEITERIMQIINDEIRNARLELDDEVRNKRLGLLFPDNYPKDKRFKKLEELRENIICSKEIYQDSVCKYVLYHLLVVKALVLEELGGTSVVPFENREVIDELSFARYGTLKDRYKFVKYYEDYSSYTKMLFDNLDFLSIEDLSTEQILELEEIENRDN